MKFRLSVLLAMMAILSGGPLQASVLITGTRLVYPAGEREITVPLQNKAAVPALVQAWVDHGGDRDQPPDEIDTPFALVPPTLRIEPETHQTLRLMYIGNDTSLPQDRESLFWLNVLDIPPKLKGAPESNQLQVAFRSRLKLFYRPKGLPYPAVEAPAKLQWRLVTTDQGQALEVHNPTPYHVTFDRVELVAADQRHARTIAPAGEGNMVIPQGRQQFALPSLTAVPTTAEVEFDNIDDYGAKQPHKAPLTP